MRNGEWTLGQGVDLHGKTLAIVGCGAIGQAVARIAAAGSACGSSATHGVRRAGRRSPHDHFELVTDDFASGRATPISSACTFPAARRMRGSSTQARLALFAARAWLINTARGAVVDEARAVRRARWRPAGRCGARRVRARTVSARGSRSRSAHAAERDPSAARRQPYRRGQLSDGASRDQERPPGGSKETSPNMDLINPESSFRGEAAREDR